MRLVTPLLLSAAAGLGLVGLAVAQSSLPPTHPQINRVTVELASTQGQRVTGMLALSPDNHGLHIQGSLRGLKANSEHGFHVHETGDCSAPDAASAGAHFNPAGVDHGKHGEGTHHAGDIPNVVANGQGEATVNLHLTGVTMGDGGQQDVLGRALVVHADPDDYSSQPAGNSGARVACGVISAPAPAAAVDAPTG